MDGSSESAFGKTPFALQEALKGHTGLCVLPLPSHVVLDNNNPWDPFIVITDSMKYLVAMSLDKHLKVITNQTEQSLLQNPLNIQNIHSR